MNFIFCLLFPEMNDRRDQYNLMISIGRGKDVAIESAYGKLYYH